MKRNAIKHAVQEAQRFVMRAEVAMAKVSVRRCDPPDDDLDYETAEGVSMAACRRASMDLTRALAKMRKAEGR